jgi:hypothetical protein
VPVDRKLVYIDPSPELSAQWAQDAHAINPVENFAAAFSLARYETIRLTPSRRYGSLTVVRVHQYKISLSKVARCANGGTPRPEFVEAPTSERTFLAWICAPLECGRRKMSGIHRRFIRDSSS